MTSQSFMPNPSDHILVASSNPVVRQRVLESLRSPVQRVEQARGGAEALGHLESGQWHILFLDRSLPDLDAEELRATVEQRFPETEVVLLDPEGSPAEHHLLAPEQPMTKTPSCGVHADSWNTELLAPLPGMIGSSSQMQPVYRASRLLARRNTTVLITGPTGCGKEVVARGIHQLSPRASRAFVVINCAAIPEALLESELFGHTRGAFTGAMQSYGGRIQAAHGGTLFLDEIGEMPLSLQPKLLRFLEQKELQRLGSSDVVRVDARVIAATNAQLPSLVRQGKFREDLYFRLCTFPLEIPPLRERPDDITVLARHFLKMLASCPPAPELSAEGDRLLKSHLWPGNVRELQNVIERALILAEDGNQIRAEHLMISTQPRRAQ